MGRRGIGSVIAAIFLVMIMGISLMALVSVYNKYKDFTLTAAEMNEWEAQRLKENLVRLTPIGGGGGGGGSNTRTVNMTFLVSEEDYNSWLGIPDAPRQWRYDDIDSNYMTLNLFNQPTYIFKLNDYDVYTGETWSFILYFYYISNSKIEVYAINSTGGAELLDILPSSGSFFERRVPVANKYIINDQLEIKMVPQFILAAQFDQIVLKANLTYTDIYYGSFLPTESDHPAYLVYLEDRDGSYLSFTSSGSFVVNITGLPDPTEFRSITAYVTVGVESNIFSPSWDFEVSAYNFSASAWQLINETKLLPTLFKSPEKRIRVPLSEDFVSTDNKIMLRIGFAVPFSSSELRIDEVTADATWIQSSGGGGGGGGGTTGNLTIRNDSPFPVTIVRFYFINSTTTIIYDPSPSLVLRPGETLDLSTIHSLDDITQVKVVTSRGNVFSFVP